MKVILPYIKNVIEREWSFYCKATRGCCYSKQSYERLEYLGDAVIELDYY